MLQPRERDEAQLVYVNPATDFSRYDRVKIDAVTVWLSEDSNLAELDFEEYKQLADHLYLAIYEQLNEDYEMVDVPGAGVLHIKLAITEAKGSKVFIDALTSASSYTRVPATVIKLTTDTHAFVGRAAVEGEIIDGSTGERLLAAVDERAGAKTLRGVTDTWADVKASYDLWAERLRERLAELRSR